MWDYILTNWFSIDLVYFTIEQVRNYHSGYYVIASFYGQWDWWDNHSMQFWIFWYWCHFFSLVTVVLGLVSYILSLERNNNNPRQGGIAMAQPQLAEASLYINQELCYTAVSQDPAKSNLMSVQPKSFPWKSE